MSRWTKDNVDIVHYTKIVHDLMNAMTTLPQYLLITLKNRQAVKGWLKEAKQFNNAADNTPSSPTSWTGSLTLQDGAREVEIDYLDIEAIRSAPPPP